MSRKRRFEIGDQVNDWTVIDFHAPKYEARCKCGTRKLLSATDLSDHMHCMKCSRTLSIEPGQRFGCSVVLKELPRGKWERLFLVDCDCGSTHSLGRKTLLSRTNCNGRRQSKQGSAQEQLTKKFANAPNEIRKSKAYELWVWLRREEDAQLCDKWKDFIPFLMDFADLMGGHPFEYCQPRFQWVYYTLERIDKEGIWDKGNVTARKFITERAYHRNTYLLWSRLKSYGLLVPELHNSYINFINTFGEKQKGYVLSRRNRRELHSRDNSYWRSCKSE